MINIEEKRNLIREGLADCLVKQGVGPTRIDEIAFDCLVFLNENDVMICSQGGLEGSVLANVERLI